MKEFVFTENGLKRVKVYSDMRDMKGDEDSEGYNRRRGHDYRTSSDVAVHVSTR
jgi:hypothetical protein